MKNKAIELSFLKSALTTDSSLMPTANFLTWMKAKREAVNVKITAVPFDAMKHWGFHPTTSNLVHSSGRFFSIEGIRVKTDWGAVKEWDQPIINQPEIGFLGIITKKFDGVLHFLMQAKIEPGNINFVQLSPTLQATKSNYTKVHKGATPLYLEYFRENLDQQKVLLDQLQSEQGARFLKKRNRNIIIEVEEDVEVYDNFCWLTLGQIKLLLLHDNTINMDTRTVISGIPFGDYPNEVIDLFSTLKSINTFNNHFEHGLLMSALNKDAGLHNMESLISWITRLKSMYELEVRRIPLNRVKKWQQDEYTIFHDEKKYFSVIAVLAEIDNREVHSWMQPLVKSAQEGLIAFVVKKINGVYHFLVQAKLESGNFDIIELAPTVQCLTGNYRKTLSPPFLEYVLNVKPEQIRYNTQQSEEGGRFYREQNHNLIVEAEDDFPIKVPENYRWMTVNQLNVFIKFNNFLNIQARSLIASIKFV